MIKIIKVTISKFLRCHSLIGFKKWRKVKILLCSCECRQCANTPDCISSCWHMLHREVWNMWYYIWLLMPWGNIWLLAGSRNYNLFFPNFSQDLNTVQKLAINNEMLIPSISTTITGLKAAKDSCNNSLHHNCASVLSLLMMMQPQKISGWLLMICAQGLCT